MAAMILANLIVMDSGILVRGVVQAYRQEPAIISKSQIDMQMPQNLALPKKQCRILGGEAKSWLNQKQGKILSVTEYSSWEEVLKKYNKLFERNAQRGSFYLQSKVHRAKECLEAVYQKKAEGSTGA